MRKAQRRGISARAFMATLSTAGRLTDIPRTTAMMAPCASCGRHVFNLFDGECFRCHQPAEGKNYRDMSERQRSETHDCGILNGKHTDGWDGAWLGCEEAARRNGR